MSRESLADAILAEANQRLNAVRQDLFFVAAKELEDLDQHQYNRAITFGIQGIFMPSFVDALLWSDILESLNWR